MGFCSISKRINWSANVIVQAYHREHTGWFLDAECLHHHARNTSTMPSVLQHSVALIREQNTPHRLTVYGKDIGKYVFIAISLNDLCQAHHKSGHQYTTNLTLGYIRVGRELVSELTKFCPHPVTGVTTGTLPRKQKCPIVGNLCNHSIIITARWPTTSPFSTRSDSIMTTPHSLS